MKKTLSIFLFTIIAPLSFGQQSFEKTYGGALNEWGTSVQQTTDGGYIITGSTASYGIGDNDIYLIKTDQFGDTTWTKYFGGINADNAHNVRQTSDNGYIIAGSTSSFGNGLLDPWLIKTNSQGDTLWTKTYGGIEGDFFKTASQTDDGGYIAIGTTLSFGSGLQDFYLVKTNASGDSLWTKTYGGVSADFGDDVAQTSDGGFIVFGYTASYGSGGDDFYIVKTNSLGDTLWTKTYGGNNNETGRRVIETSDGGYLLTGSTESFGSGQSDYFLVKTNSSGDTLWTRAYGGAGNEFGFFSKETSDGGFITIGNSESFGSGSGDIYLIRTNSAGDTLWTKTFGGTNNEVGKELDITNDNGFILIGNTESLGNGAQDIYLIKLDESGEFASVTSNPSSSYRIELYPNPVNEVLNIVCPEKFVGKSVFISDASGKIVQENIITQSTYSIETKDLEAGVYYVNSAILNVAIKFLKQ